MQNSKLPRYFHSKYRTLSLVFIAVATLPMTLFGDGFIRDGVGARTIGRGGINLGFADNGQIILDNPAAIANIEGMGLSEIGFDLLFTDLSYSDPDNTMTGAVDNPLPVGQLSFMTKTADPNIGLGFGVFSHAGFAAEYELNGPAPFFSGPQHYKSLGALLRVLPAISVRMNNRLTVGANLGVAVNHTELEGPYTLQGPNAFATTPTRFDLQATGAALSWAAGFQYRLTQRTTFGFNYQGESRFNLDGNTFVTIPGLGSARFDTEAQIEWPRSVALGFKHQVDCCTDVGFDVYWYNWNRAFNSFETELSDPNNPVIAAVVGNQIQENFPLNWRDTVSARFGIQRKIGRGQTLRGGYVYHRNPIPDGTVSPYIQAILEHAFSAGYGWQSNGYEFDVAYQYSFGKDQNVGTSQFLGGDFDNSTSRARVHWLSFSAMQRF